MTEQNARSRLSTKMGELARELQRENASVERTLQSITQIAVDNVAGAAHAGITLVIGRRKVESRAATSALPRVLDEYQQQFREGPCMQSVWEHETVHSPVMESDERWPRFSAAAVERGVGSMLSFQLYTDRDNLGALNLYGAEPLSFSRDSIDTGFALATHAAIALATAQRQAQWQSSLASRDIIGQAKGMIMERYDVDAVTAFHLLARLSQDTNRKVEAVARDLVARRNDDRSSGGS